MAKEVFIISFTETIAWMQQHIAFVDSTFKELLIAQHSEVKACHLSTSLGARVFQDVAEPRNGMSISMWAARPEQVSSLISYVLLRSLDVMNS